MFRFASFDPGKKNFAQYVEDCSIETLQNLRNEYTSLPKKYQRRVKGVMNSHIEDILNKLHKSSTRVSTGVYDLRSEDAKDTTERSKSFLDIPTRKNIINHLEKFTGVWDTCDVFIIEQQFFSTFGYSKNRFQKKAGSQANVDAIKVSEIISTWFLSEYPFKEVIFFGSNLKTQILGAPWKMTKPQRKRWAVEKSREIYEFRGDRDMIELFLLKDRIFRKRLNSKEKIEMYLKTFNGKSKDSKILAKRLVKEKQKLDDIADTHLQCQAFKFKYFVGEF